MTRHGSQRLESMILAEVRQQRMTCHVRHVGSEDMAAH